MPTRRRQNIITNPATAANTEAMGISVSGPIYKRHALRECCGQQGAHRPPPARLWTPFVHSRHKLPGNGIAFTLPRVAEAATCCTFPATDGATQRGARRPDPCQAPPRQPDAVQPVTLTHHNLLEPSEYSNVQGSNCLVHWPLRVRQDHRGDPRA